MPQHDPLQNAFPESTDVISKQRKTDPVFDEMCRDFEELSRRIPAEALRHQDSLNSLQALRDEIAESLTNLSDRGTS